MIDDAPIAWQKGKYVKKLHRDETRCRIHRYAKVCRRQQNRLWSFHSNKLLWRPSRSNRLDGGAKVFPTTLDRMGW